jgi:hypothetical protein
LDVTVYSVADIRPVLRIYAPDSRTPVHADDVSKWRELLLAEVPFDSDELARAWEVAPLRSTLPAIGGLAMDELGRLWVGAYVQPGAAARSWTVFGTDGHPNFVVDLPAAESVRLPGSGEILALGHDRIALLRRDRLGVESVEAWSFQSPTEP